MAHVDVAFFVLFSVAFSENCEFAVGWEDF
jgi:hypothetical protein